MGISRYPSAVTLPQMKKPYPTLPEFLSTRFSSVPRETWEQRIAEGKVLDEAAKPILPDTSYVPGRRILYFREVALEPVIPFSETILYQDDEILVACKPPFLPVIPGGNYVNECLLYRLRKRTGNSELVPLHRIDRETAGIVLFSVNRLTRNCYAELFRNGIVEKTYQAHSRCVPPAGPTTWVVANRIVRGEPWFRMKTAPGPVNARSIITLTEARDGMAHFVLHPETGKTHQLRIHMSDLGFGILNDRLYPELQPETADNYDTPLQLLAGTVRFQDPVTGHHREFSSERKLSW
jgi:tRNA pseudouridine32 synthase/23S rRNA pseudouridine746 synthase